MLRRHVGINRLLALPLLVEDKIPQIIIVLLVQVVAKRARLFAGRGDQSDQGLLGGVFQALLGLHARHHGHFTRYIAGILGDERINHRLRQLRVEHSAGGDALQGEAAEKDVNPVGRDVGFLREDGGIFPCDAFLLLFQKAQCVDHDNGHRF